MGRYGTSSPIQHIIRGLAPFVGSSTAAPVKSRAGRAPMAGQDIGLSLFRILYRFEKSVSFDPGERSRGGGPGRRVTDASVRPVCRMEAAPRP
jgi:hypothetical protein